MKFVFVFAHPDDESFSSGGTIAKLTKANHQVILITATKGEAGELGNPPIATFDKLGAIRETELRKAAKILGVSHIYFLEYIDGTLIKVNKKLLEENILKLYKKIKPDVIITFDKTGGSNHPDHKTISKTATNSYYDYKNHAGKNIKLYHTVTPKRLIKIFEEKGLSYTAFGKVKGVIDEEITTAINIADNLRVKIKALKAHKTQRRDVERFLSRKEVANLNFEYFKLIDEENII